MEILFTDDHIGTVLDGNQGWHNSYRIVELAVGYGFALSDEDNAKVAKYRNGDRDVDIEGIIQSAEGWLQSQTADGLTFYWIEGDLSIIPHCQMEMWLESDGCAHCDRKTKV